LPPRPSLFPYTTLFRSRHGQGGEGEGTAEAVDVEHGAETGQGTVVQQRLDPRTQGVRIATQLFGQRLPGLLYQRQAMLQAVDQADRKSTRLNSSHVKIS